MKMFNVKKGMAAVLALSLSVALAGCSSGMDAGAKDGGRAAPAAKTEASVPSKGVMNQKEGDFMLTDIDGKVHKLSDYKGKKVYIKFWASWCSVCLATLADTDALAGSADRDYVVLSIVAPGFGGEMKKEDFIKWYRGLGYKNLTVLLDEGGAVTKKYGIRFYPTGAIVDTEGNVQLVRPGHMDAATLKKEMAAIH